eukprot:Gb_13470 [translate_table: standard]
MLRWLNDGLERSGKLLGYIKKQWRELQWMEDDKITYASQIATHAPEDKKPILAWPHPRLIEQIIWGLGEKYLPNSSFRAQRLLVIDHPLTSPMAQYDYWANNEALFLEEPYRMAWSPPSLPTILFLGVQEKTIVTEKGKDKKKSFAQGSKLSKRKHSKFGFVAQPDKCGSPHFHPTCGRPNPLTQWCNVSSETNPSLESSSDIVPPPTLRKIREKRKGCFTPTEISALGALPSEEKATLAIEFLPDLRSHVHLLRKKAFTAKEAPPIPPDGQTKLEQMEFELEAYQKDQEIFEHIEEIQKLKDVAAQLVYDGFKGRTNDRILTNKASRIVQLPGFKESGVKRSLLGTLRDCRCRATSKYGGIEEEQVGIAPSSEGKCVLAPAINQPKEPLLGSPRREFRVGKTLDLLRHPGIPDVERLPPTECPNLTEHPSKAIESSIDREQNKTAGPHQDPEAVAITSSSMPPRLAPPSPTEPHTSSLFPQPLLKTQPHHH